jgi:hypothetical protein
MDCRDGLPRLLVEKSAEDADESGRRRDGMMKWRWIVAAQVLLFASPSFAESLPWATDVAVGPSQVVYTIDLSCPNVSFVCDQIDGYHEQDISIVTGAATFDFDNPADTIQFETDSSQDVGSGPQDAYLTMTGTDLVFPNIAFAGVPVIIDVVVFALTNPLISVPGLEPLIPGDYPFSETIGYSGTGMVIGQLEFILGPDIVVPQDDIVVSGIFRVLGDPDFDGMIEYEIRDVTGTFAVQSAATMGGEPVTVDVTADMTLNLSGELQGPGGTVLPALGPVGAGVLALSLLLASRVVQCRGRGRGRARL